MIGALKANGEICRDEGGAGGGAGRLGGGFMYLEGICGIWAGMNSNLL